MANYPQLDDQIGVWKLKEVNDAVMGGYWRVSSGNSGLFGGGQSSNAANSQSVVDQFNFASSGNSTSFGDLNLSFRGSPCRCIDGVVSLLGCVLVGVIAVVLAIGFA